MDKQSADFQVSKQILQSKLFEGLEYAEMTVMILNAKILSVPTGTAVLNEGEQGDEFYWIKSGRLDVQMNSIANKGKPISLNTLKAGDVFGEMILLGKMRRNASVVVQNDCELYSWNFKETLALFEKSPMLGFKIMRNLAHMLGDKLTDMNLQLRGHSEVLDKSIFSFFG